MRRIAIALVSLAVSCGARSEIAGSDPFDEDGSVPVVTADAHVDTGTACSMRVPQNHRVSALSCPTTRGPGDANIDGGSSPCNQDSDCTMGKNGRCILSEQDWGKPTCSYDDCDTDSDCAGNVACVCRASATDTAPNRCAISSGCRVDSDCGPCGYCSPSGNGFFPPPAYFCHTKEDVCTDDTDCEQTPGQCQNGCNYDPQASQWSCSPECPP